MIRLSHMLQNEQVWGEAESDSDPIGSMTSHDPRPRLPRTTRAYDPRAADLFACGVAWTIQTGSDGTSGCHVWIPHVPVHAGELLMAYSQVLGGEYKSSWCHQ